MEEFQQGRRSHARIMVDRQGNVSPAPEYPKPLKELAFPSPSAR